MNRQVRLFPLYLACAGLLLSACGSSPPPTPDLVSTEVAVQLAAAATLTAQAPSPAATPTPAAQSPTSSPPPQVTTDTLAATATPTPPPSARCTVTSPNLNLRSGPGTAYSPPIGAISAGTELEPVAYSPVGYPEGLWVQVRVLPGGQTGWVSAGSQFITCNVDLAGLPPGAAPPTPPLPTNTPVPVPTPTRPLLALVPVDGGQSNLEGQIFLPGYAQEQVSNPMVFRDKLVFGVLVHDPAAGSDDGAGIEDVTIQIVREDDGEQVHERTEQNAHYCVFGGGEPDCNVLVFDQSGNQWPDSHEPITSGDYHAFINIRTKRGETERWNWGFQIERPEIKMRLVQVGPGSTDLNVNQALVFQVEAYDSGQGNRDGQGISHVDMTIIEESNGQVVYDRTEQNAKYCAFSGGEPDCNVWVFADHDNNWPSGEPVHNGTYILRAVAHGRNGRKATLEVSGVTIELP